MKNIVLNIPHSSINGLYDSRFGKWTKNPQFINDIVNKWTDWFTDYLFIENDLNIKSVVFPYSRFVCDVERLENDTMEDQGIVYTSFDGYKRDLNNEQIDNIKQLWKSHQENLIKCINKDTILIDCHSFPSEIENVDICIGYNDDWSFDEKIVNIIKTEFETMGYSVALNKPFSNSITPKTNFDYKSVMIEVNKRVYMNENTLTLNPNVRQWMRWSGTLNSIYNNLLNL